jgi:hypothetical protein
MPQGINLSDPGVQDLLGDAAPSRLASGRPGKELVQLAGDPDHGMTVSHHLDRGKREVLVAYKDLVLTVDIYEMAGEPLKVHLICPRCHHQLQVTSDRKKIEYDPRAGDPKKGGRLSIEPFECTWELPTAGKHVPGLLAGGMSLCKLKLAIDHNVAKDA